MNLDVIIPVYNGAEFICQAIRSVYSQSSIVPEIVVVDDGSKDRTVEIVKSNYPQVRVVSKENGGSASARNFGIKISNREWIAFLDHDDLWTPDHLSSLFGALSKMPDAKIAYSGKKWISKEGKPLSRELTQSEFPRGWIFENLYYRNVISSMSCVVAHRDVFNLCGLFRTDKEICFADDYEMWLKAAARVPITSNGCASVLYRRHEHNLTNNRIEDVLGRLEAIKSANKIIEEKKISPENKIDGIRIHKRMRSLYSDSVITVFWLRRHDLVKQLAIESFRQGIVDKAIVIRFLISIIAGKICTKEKCVI